MLAADRRAVDSELQAQAVQIKNIEMVSMWEGLGDYVCAEECDS